MWAEAGRVAGCGGLIAVVPRSLRSMVGAGVLTLVSEGFVSFASLDASREEDRLTTCGLSSLLFSSDLDLRRRRRFFLVGASSDWACGFCLVSGVGLGRVF